MNKDLAKDMSDVQTAKTTFLVLIRMVHTWGGPDIQSQAAASQGNSLAPPATIPQLPGFDRFMMTEFSPICWALVTHPNFDSQDAQTKQALGEAAGLQQAIYAKTGDKYLAWLKDYELSGIGMDSVFIEEYLRALSTSDVKGFRRFFQVKSLTHSLSPRHFSFYFTRIAKLTSTTLVESCSKKQPKSIAFVSI